jgi:hypothetical protein
MVFKATYFYLTFGLADIPFAGIESKLAAFALTINISFTGFTIRAAAAYISYRIFCHRIFLAMYGQ